jgi:D-glycero-D-manno-heptose 1,7-bisphosphate phosphatase
MGVGSVTGGRAVFLDRDGVLNRNVFNPVTGAYESPHRAEDFELLPGVLDGLALLLETGYRLILVSNQPSYAKGKTTLAAMRAIHQRLVDALENAGVSFDAFYYCLHHPDGIIPEYSGRCECRKPSPYFLLQAKAQFDLDLANSWMIGDRETDILCGRAAGLRTIRVAADHPVPEPSQPTAADRTARDLADAATLLRAADRLAGVPPLGRSADPVSLCDNRRS